MYGRWLRNSFIYLLILVAIVVIVYAVLQGSGDSPQKVELSQFIENAKAGEVSEVDVDGQTLKFKLEGGDDTTYQTKMEKGDTVRSILQENGVAPGDAEYPEVEIKE